MNIRSLARTITQARGLIVQRVLAHGRSAQETAKMFGVGSKTVHKWLARYQVTGAPGLSDRPSRPHRSPEHLEAARGDLILQLRYARQTGPQIACGLRMARSTVARVLHRAGGSEVRP